MLGGNWNALGHARALGPLGVPVYLVFAKGTTNFAAFSRFVHASTSPDPVQQPERAIQFVLDLGRILKPKPVLFLCDDAWMFAAGKLEAEVRDLFYWPLSSWEKVERILNKRTLYRLAKEIGVNAPATREFSSVAGMLADARELTYPCIVKPEITVNYLERMPATIARGMHHRTRLMRKREDLCEWAEVLVQAGIEVPLLTQEYINGGAEQLYTLTSYSDRRGCMVVGSVGHKVRQFPPEAGCIVSGRLRHIDAVYEQGKKLLDALKFHGLANTEFKYDARDGSYRLMEINPRLGMWNGSAYAAGLNLPAIAYRDMLGETYAGPAFSSSMDGALWIDALIDALNCVYRYRASGYGHAHLGLVGWLRSIQGPRIHAVWNWSDPVPFLAHACQTASLVIRRLFQKFV